jgi:hypothetical protein
MIHNPLGWLNLFSKYFWGMIVPPKFKTLVIPSESEESRFFDTPRGSFREFFLSQLPRSFAEFILSRKPRPFASLRVTGEGLRMTY